MIHFRTRYILQLFVLVIFIQRGGLALDKAQAAKATPAPLTAELLSQGLKVPVQRDFPFSKTVSACENFHQYVCGEVEKSFELPKDRSSWFFSFSDNDEKLLNAKKNYMKWIDQGGSPSTSRAKPIKNMYLSCMNVKASEMAEKNVIQAISSEIDGFKDSKALAKWLIDNVKKGRPSIWGMVLDADLKHLDKHDVIFYADLFTLPERSYYENPAAVKDLESLAKEFYLLLGIPNPEDKAKELVEFEKKAVLIYPTPSEERTLSNVDTYVERDFWQKSYPHLALENFLKDIPAGIRTRNMYAKTFEFLNKELESKSWEDLKSILKFQLLVRFTRDSYPEFYKKKWNFDHLYLGASPEPPPRDEQCTQLVTSTFGKELDFELIKILFPSFPRGEVEQIVADVRSSLRNQISKNSWLSEEARTEAVKKIDSAKMNLVSPKAIKDWDFNLPIKTIHNDPIQNIENVRKSFYQKRLKKLASPRDHELWSMSPLTVNAYYSPDSNKFVLLQGVLQHPFFSSKLSRTERIGAIGVVVGHELGHGIDDQGSKYDSTGVLRTWLKGEDLENFKKRSDVFRTRLDNIQHNGSLKLGEAIGDHVGLFAAYDAAFASSTTVSKAQRKTSAPSSGGAVVDSYSDPEKTKQEREFFVSYARVWCSKATPQFEEIAIKTRPHPLGRVRINEQVIHHEAFQRAFSCKPGDKMYLKPEERAAVWVNPLPGAY